MSCRTPACARSSCGLGRSIGPRPIGEQVFQLYLELEPLALQLDDAPACGVGFAQELIEPFTEALAQRSRAWILLDSTQALARLVHALIELALLCL